MLRFCDSPLLFCLLLFYPLIWIYCGGPVLIGVVEAFPLISILLAWIGE